MTLSTFHLSQHLDAKNVPKLLPNLFCRDMDLRNRAV